MSQRQNSQLGRQTFSWWGKRLCQAVDPLVWLETKLEATPASQPFHIQFYIETSQFQAMFSP